jgi:hypothetical protein
MPMWTDEQRQRYILLREREQGGMLADEERAELVELMQALNDHDAAYLAPANGRKAQEITVLAAAAERLEVQNRRLQEYLRERQTFLARVKSLVTDLHAEDRQIRERYADVLTLIGTSPTRKEP